MPSLFLLFILESFKKLWVETEEFVTGRMILTMHIVLYVFYLSFWFYSFEPAEEYSDDTEYYNEGIVIRPKEVQNDIDIERKAKERTENVERFIFSASGVALFFSLIGSVANSIMLYKRRAVNRGDRYKEVGRYLFWLFATSPITVCAAFVFLSIVTSRDTYYSADPFSSGYFGIIVFAFYGFLIYSLYRLYSLGIYEVRVGKLMLWFLGFSAIAALGLMALFVAAMSAVKFGG